MMLIVVLGKRKPDGVTPYAMAQVEDHAYAEEHVRLTMEREATAVLRRQYDGIPVRLVWIEQDGVRLPAPELLEALANGAGIPWTVVQDTDLTGESGT